MPRENEIFMHDAARGVWLRFRDPLRVVETFKTQAVTDCLREAERAVNSEGLWAAGFVSYEAAPAFDPALRVHPPVPGLPLLWLGLYASPEVCPAPGPSHADLLDAPPFDFDRDCDVGAARYHAAFRQIKEKIGQGEIYQANLTLRLRAGFHGSPSRLFASMVSAQEAGYAAYVHLDRWILCSASPELFFELDGPRLRSIPMKGTRGRGLWSARDLENGRRLRRSVKERAENAMIVDMVRNDLGRVAEAGSVRVPRLFEVLRLPTVWQMVTPVEARTGASVLEIMRALFPPASVTGAPKCRAMQVIRAVESSPRGVYTGTIGFMAPGRRAQFNVAIRTAVCDVRERRLEYGVGGGIVWDSREKREFDECRLKTQVLKTRRLDFDLIETLLWAPTPGFVRLAAHLRRLKASSEYFGRTCDLQMLRRCLDLQSRDWSGEARRVRLVLSAAGRVEVQSEPLRPLPPVARVCLAGEPVDSGNRFLYHKTTRREVYQQALENRVAGCDDVLLWNPKGEITETCIANLLVVLDGVTYTPPLSCGLLPGILRAEILRSGQARERVIRREELAQADGIRLISSLRGIREARLVPRPPR